MGERPKTPFELANEMLLNSKPPELLKEVSAKSPSLDGHITNEIDITRVRSVDRQGGPPHKE